MSTSTFHPHQDSAGNTKPGGFGTVVGPGGVIEAPSIGLTEAQARFPGLVNVGHDLPLTVPAR